jgi:hypothetical protein
VIADGFRAAFSMLDHARPPKPGLPILPMRHALLALAAAVVVACATPAFVQPVAAQQATAVPKLDIVTQTGRYSFNIEIAADDEKRAEGLMFRTKLEPDYGMLFDFKREQQVYFWMRNTYVSLDMIFVRADGTVVNVAENTTPLSEATVPSSAPVRFVLEVVAGTAKRIGLKAGDKLVHPLMRPNAG